MIDPAHLSPWLLLLGPLMIVIAYTVFGLSGFGSTVVAIPVLAHFLPVTFLVPMMAVLDLFSSAFLGTRGREQVAKQELKWLIPCMLAGFALGATVLVSVPDRYLRVALGVFTVAIGVNSIVNPVLHRTISRWWVVPSGLIGGSIATIFGAGGPIYATYLSGRLHDKTEIRSTLSALISISAFSRAAIYAVSGLLLHLAVGAAIVLLFPFVWIGLKLGGRIHVGLTQVQMRRAIGALLLLTGASLLVRVFL
jgi:uncharacterized protein